MSTQAATTVPAPVWGFVIWRSPGKLSGPKHTGEGFTDAQAATSAGRAAIAKLNSTGRRYRWRGKVLKDGLLDRFFGDHS